MAPTLSSTQLSDFVLGKLSPEESLRVLDALERDPEASRMVDEYAALLAFAHGEGADLFHRRAPSLSRSNVQPFKRAVRLIAGRRWIVAAAAVVAIAMVTVLVLRGKSILWGDEMRYASLSELDFGVGIRAEADDNLTVALELYRERDYDRSVRVLERMLRSEPAHPFPDHVYYFLGAVHLAAAEQNVIGPVRVYDRERVRMALESLHRAGLLTPRARLAEESYWLIAKGHLMLGERGKACEVLERVLEYRGKRGPEARRIKILIECEE